MNVRWWIGVVENKNDPEKRGRLQVRILGVHPPRTVQKSEQDGIGVPTEDLPWCIPCMPLTYGGTAVGTCAPPAVMAGAWVLGIALDGDAYSNNLVLGIISVTMSTLATNPGNGDMSMADSPTQQYNPSDSCMENYYNIIESNEGSRQGQTSSKGAMGVMQVMPNTVIDALRYTKKYTPEKYEKFVESSGIEISDDTQAKDLARTNEDFNRLIGRGYYTYLYERFEDPIIASAAYNSGPGNAQKYLEKYGDPRKGELTYEEFANRIESGGNKETARYVRNFISKLGEDGMELCKEQAQPTTTDESTGEQVPITTSGTVTLPTQSNVITSKFGPRNVSNGSSNHKGIDLRAPMNAMIYAAMDGTVTYVENQTNYGAIYIDHGDGIQTRYLHNNKPNVTVGQKVSAGDTIAYAGGRGPVTVNGAKTSKATKYTSHLHFEVRKNGSPVDPEQFLAQNNVTTQRKSGA